MNRIVTFYSYKGGVGRTFALANVAALLAKRGRKVLVIDWDLEAPGLHRYFKLQMATRPRPMFGLIHILTEAATNPDARWESSVENISLGYEMEIALIASGDQAVDYADRVRAFSWEDFFEKCRGGAVLERWRTEWKQQFDFVLVDSRTGITDSGGVCTVLLPDILVLVFSANEQSFEGGLRVALGIQEARQKLHVPRPPVAILPLPSRFDGRDEIDESKRWLDRFGTELKPFYDDWLPRRIEPRQMLELTKVPYVTKFSFGEPLPVLTHGVTDPELPGFYLENVARLLTSDFRDAAQIVAPEAIEGEFAIAEIRTQLAQVPLDEAAIERALQSAGKDLTAEPGFAELLNEAGFALFLQARYELAERYLKRALELSESEFGAEHPVALSSLNYLAKLWSSTGRLTEAAAAYRKVLDQLRTSLGPAHPALAVACSNLATSLRQLGQLDEAGNFYRQAIEILEHADSQGDPFLFLAYEGLGTVLRQLGHLDEAEDLYRRALERLESTARSGDPSAARIYNSLGMLLQQAGRLDEAESLYRRALERLESVARPGDPAVSKIYDNLADIFRRLGRLDEAESLYRRALEGLESVARPGDPATVRAYNGLGMLLQESGRLDEAEHVYRRALDRLESVARPGNPAVARIYSSLGTLLRRSGRLDEAESLYRRAIERLGGKARPGDLAVAKVYKNLADIHTSTAWPV
jgi:tetratricopeptide (TPR) repeat protein/MinD-like ATPase involved in chromosome partitioning or flagellar assembly